MRRRDFILSLAGAGFSISLKARAQPSDRSHLIGYLGGASRQATEAVISAFQAGLRDLGYVEQKSIAIAYRFADENLERLPALARELVELNPNVILAGSSAAAVAAHEATSTIPIVCPVISDPIRLGLAMSHARPSGNVTGFLVSVEGLPAKQLELAMEAVPGTKRIGLLINIEDVAAALAQRRGIENAAPAFGVEILAAEVRLPEDLVHAFQKLQDAQALIVFRDSMLFSERNQIAALAKSARLPTIYGYREHVEAGGFVSYGVSLPENFRRAATYVDKIFRGSAPSELPLEFPTKLELVINLATAKALGLAVPPSLLARADEVIE
jgi:putative tryptophan/tyrosine transport system substrate-binding protein